MDEHKPQYWGVLPAEVRYCPGLPATAKVLYTEISALTQMDGICYATMRVLMRKSPRDWNTQQRDRVCAVLGIQTVLQVVGAPQTGGGAL